MDNEKVYTAYTDEEIERLKMINQEIGKISERQIQVKEDLFNTSLKMTYEDIAREISGGERK